MQIIKVTSNKKQYLPLLLLADEEEAMIDAIWSTAPCMCLKMVALRLNAL